MRTTLEAERAWRQWRNGGEDGERDLALDLTVGGGEFLGSSEDSTGLNSFHTAKSCLSNQVRLMDIFITFALVFDQTANCTCLSESCGWRSSPVDKTRNGSQAKIALLETCSGIG